jgi:hypothetical protein
MTSSPLWRGGGRIFPNKPDENFSQKVNKKMYRAGMAPSCRSWRATAAWPWSTRSSVEAPKTKLLAAKLQGHGPGPVLVIADVVDDNLWLAARNLHNVLVWSPVMPTRSAWSSFKKVLVTKEAVEAQGDVRMSAARFERGASGSRSSWRRSSPKRRRMLADKHEQVIFRVAAPTPPSPRSRPPSSCCSRCRSPPSVANVKGKTKRFGRFIGRRDHCQEGLCVA